MAFDAHKNFAISTVVTPPSPATSGTTLVVTMGEGARFPAAPFNATVWPAGQIPTPGTAEVVRVTGRSSDTLSFARAQEGSTARSIIVGDYFAASITTKALTDVESGTNFPLISTGTGTFDPAVNIGSGGTAAANTSLTINGTTATATGAIMSLLANGSPVGYVAREAAVLATGTSSALAVAGATTSGLSISNLNATAPIRFHLGSALPERGRMFAGGGLAWGTTTEPAAGRALIAGGVASATGTVSAANVTWTTLFTVSLNSSSDIGMFLVQAGLGVGDAAAHAAYGIVVADGNSLRIVTNNSTNMQLQVSGMNVQAQQNNGVTLTVKWTALRIN